MIVETVVRGNVVEFTATFADANGDTVTPDSATVTVDYLGEDSERTDETVEMTEQTGGWFASWDSSVAQPANVYWCIRSVEPASAKDGVFKLAANRANLASDEA